MAERRKRRGIFARLRANLKRRADNRNRNRNASPLNAFARRGLKNLKKEKGRVQPKFDITKPINNETKPKVSVNELGLKSNLPKESVSDKAKVNEEQKDIVTKLNEGAQDSETVNVLDRAIDLVINVVDEVSVTTPDIRSIEYPKVVRGADFIGYDVDFNIGWDSIHANYVKLFVGNSTDFVQLSVRGTQSFNVKDLIERYNVEVFDEGDKVKIPLKLIPVNTEGQKVVEGLTENIPILFDKGDLNIPRQVAINRFAEGFISQFSNCEFDESNFLTHLLHLGDGDNKVITTWLGSEDSLILKLYEPLPTSVTTNQKVWITKIQSKPIIDTINIFGGDEKYCPPLQGPNFSLEVDTGIGYQMYEDLLASGSATNTDLIRKYANQNGINTEKLNIEYVTGSDYTFQNYIHFGSAEERIKNFWYKIELLESYQSKYTELTTTDIELGYVLAEGAGQDGYVIISEDDDNIQLDGTVVTAITTIQANKQLNNINNLIGSFDGFENFLYTSTDDLAYPKVGNSIVATTDSTAISWYNGAVNAGAIFDRNNVDYMNNNLPEFITEDYQNEDFMLFMDMLGHHFDVIWAYINTLNELRNPKHKSNKGFSNELVSTMLESLGWDGKKAYDSQFLWEYALGQHKDGTQKYQQSLKSANEEIWRRILNNLPYLLKHKGTSRSLKAVMACYGVPQSLLTIMEFGGPTDPTDGGTQPFTFEDRTSALKFEGGQYITLPWKETEISDSLENIEMNVKFNSTGNQHLVKGWDGVTTFFELEATQTTGSFGKIKVFVSSSSNTYEIESSEIKLFDENYKTIALTNELDTNSSASLGLYVKESLNNRLIINDYTSSIISESLQWDSFDTLLVGSSSYISLDEFRIWKDSLDDNIITTHTKQPDSIVGNNYTASSEDMLVRFDFEYPKNRFVDSSILNVAISSEYDLPSASLFGFSNQSTYPYNYEVYERSVTAQVPSLGFNQADKIRFESQTLVSDLSYKVRATKKSLDRAPIDSSRLGLFFSPIKELNMDIIKSLGNFNIDNYIGAPADEYKDEYTELKDVRDYYFQRLNRDIYEYIRLIRYIDKSLFDVLEDLVPARAKVSKGLLIEPHYLERSKTKWKQPKSVNRGIDITIDVDETTNLVGDNNQFSVTLDVEKDANLSHQYDNYDAIINEEEEIVLTSTNPQYDSSIDVDEDTNLVGNYPTYLSEIIVPDGSKLEALVEGDSFQQVGMDPNSLSNAGFGLYAPIAGTGSLNTIDYRGNVTSSRKLIFKTKEEYIEKISVQTKGYPATSNNEQVEYELQDVIRTRSKVTILPIGSTPPSVGNEITEVIPLNGYFPTHYRFKNNLSQGLKNSFFEGSKQSADTTPDGLSPVEIFTTNPNILRVADTGRGSGEPILEVD